MRSIPEKTLEHWTSIYLSNRFPNGALWWPTAGEDVLLELPQLAATGPGETFALELKTTEAVANTHVLEINTGQLDRYLRPPVGPPLPVYYVFPLPHWNGPLTSRSGMSPRSPMGTKSAPPEWWRQRTGRPWFGKWLYVMSAQSVSEALPPDWRSKNSAKLFTLETADQPVKWMDLFPRMPFVAPYGWKQFWQRVHRNQWLAGVRWQTFVDSRARSNHVLVLDNNEWREWPLGSLLDQPELTDDLRTRGEPGEERAILHIPRHGAESGRTGTSSVTL